MPGQFDNPESWGELPLVVDTSAWTRAHHPSVRAAWQRAVLAGRLRIPPAARLEILFTTRDGKSFEAVADRLSALRAAPLTATVISAAESAMRTLAHRSAGAQRIPIVDYLIAAAAQELAAAVIHYDHDYDTLAEVMDFDSVWLARAGSLS